MGTATVQREKPILFSGPMVKAILSGAKSQTRRIMKPQPHEDYAASDFTIERYCPATEDDGGMLTDGPEIFGAYTDDEGWKCPFGGPGDKLWVRETFGFGWDSGAGFYTALSPSGRESQPEKIFYKATGNWDESNGKHCWRPSIHMPRWASRLTLEIKDVRVQRLQEISEEDAKAEGMDVSTCEQVFSDASKGVEMEWLRWVYDEESGQEEDEDYCHACAKKVAKKKNLSIDGWNDHFERDVVPRCDKCGAILCHSLTEYGVERELFLEGDDGTSAEYFSATGADAAILQNLAVGIGDLQEIHHGRLAQIGFATLWDQINGKDSWKSNPFVWAISFEVLK